MCNSKRRHVPRWSTDSSLIAKGKDLVVIAAIYEYLTISRQKRGDYKPIFTEGEVITL